LGKYTGAVVRFTSTSVNIAMRFKERQTANILIERDVALPACRSRSAMAPARDCGSRWATPWGADLRSASCSCFTPRRWCVVYLDRLQNWLHCERVPRHPSHVAAAE